MLCPYRRRIFLIGFLYLTGGLALGAHRGLYRQIPSWHVTEQISRHVLVDWSGGYIFARAEVRLPKIRTGISDGSEGTTASSLTEARALARRKARELAKGRLASAVLRLPLDDAGTIQQHMNQSRALRERLGLLESAFLVRSRRTGDGRVSIELALPFKGKGGLYSLVADRYYNSEAIPSVDFDSGRDRISSLIVDLSEFPDFRPSLEPRIYTEQGRLIYGPELVSQTCTIRYGLVSLYKSEAQARRDVRAGPHPYYTFAGGLVGTNKSNLFLDGTDATRLLGNADGRRALRRCQVILILAK